MMNKNGKLSFLGVEVSLEGDKFFSTIYRKPTFCAVYRHSDSYLPITYKFGMNCTLAFNYFSICFTGLSYEFALLKKF